MTTPEKAKSDRLGSNMDQIPFQAVEAIGIIFAEGEAKYGRDNWKAGRNDKDYQRERLNHAILHLQKYANGDTTERHLAKVAWFCVTQLYFDYTDSVPTLIQQAPVSRPAQYESIYTDRVTTPQK